MGWFSSKSPKEKMQDEYRKLMEQSYKMSTTDRKKSDALRAEAEELIKKIEAM